jgi:uncharacterized protein YuzB (UPF0349 family)
MDKIETRGAKKITFDYDVLNALLRFKVTKGFCADHLGVSEDVIERRLREDFNMTYTEYHELKLQRTSYTLQQKAIEMALAGDKVMMIFCLKNIAKWADRNETTVETTDDVKKLIVNLHG